MLRRFPLKRLCDLPTTVAQSVLSTNQLCSARRFNSTMCSGKLTATSSTGAAVSEESSSNSNNIKTNSENNCTNASPSYAVFNGMAFAATKISATTSTTNNNNNSSCNESSNSSNNALLAVEHHVTAWYRPAPFDMVMAYNVLQQLARRGGGGGGATGGGASTSVSSSSSNELGSSGDAKNNNNTLFNNNNNNNNNNIRLTCTFPTLPSTYMNMNTNTSTTVSPSAPPTFVSSPLLSHVEFLCVSVSTPIAQQFINSGAAAAAGSSSSSVSVSAPLRSVLVFPSAAPSSTPTPNGTNSSAFNSNNNGASQPPPSAAAPAATATATAQHQYHHHQQQQQSSAQSAPLNILPLTTFAGTPAPAGADPMTFIVFQDGTLVGWNAPWSEMLSMRNLLSITAADVKDEAERLQHSCSLGGCSGSSAAVSDGAALASILASKAAVDSASGVVTVHVPSAPCSPSSSMSDGGASISSGSGGASPSSSTCREGGERVTNTVLSSSSLSAARWLQNTLMGIKGLGWGRGGGGGARTRGGGGLSSRATSSYLHDLVGSALSSQQQNQQQQQRVLSSSGVGPFSASASPALPLPAAFLAATSGIDTMRFSFFDQYPNAYAAAAERREQLEESGDWVPGPEPDIAPAVVVGLVPPAATVSLVSPSSSSPLDYADNSALNRASGTTTVDVDQQQQQRLRVRVPLWMRNFIDADKDCIVLADRRDHFKVPFSYALAQSVKLDAIDHSITPISASVKTWQQRLAATGRLACGVKALRRTKTRLLSLEEALNFKNNVQTTPKVFWSGELQFVRNGYKDACEHLEIEDRREVLQNKMGMVDESLSYLHDEVHAHTMEVLTWIIIILIAFEISVAFGALHAAECVWRWFVALLF